MTALLVAATGGHLNELARLRPRLVPDEDVVWVTFAGSQAEQLLEGEDVVHAYPTPPRHYMAVARNLLLARRLLRERHIDRVISNGAGVALSFLPLARARGIETHYVECAARTLGPSLTGRLLSAVPGMRLYTQFPEWAGRRWVFGGSTLEGFEVDDALSERSPRRILVTLGTMAFPFTRLVDRLRKVVPPEVEVVWQTGGTPLEGLVNAHASLGPDELKRQMSEADVVVAHGGLGSALDTLAAGRLPVLVPRRRAFGEHVDDHQVHMSYGFERRGLAIAREADALSWDDIKRAASLRVRTIPDPPRFRLR